MFSEKIVDKKLILRTPLKNLLNYRSPFPETPYNPQSRQKRIRFIISGDSDAASRF